MDSSRVIGAIPIVMDRVHLQQVKENYSLGDKKFFSIPAFEESLSGIGKIHLIIIINMSFQVSCRMVIRFKSFIYGKHNSIFG